MLACCTWDKCQAQILPAGHLVPRHLINTSLSPLVGVPPLPACRHRDILELLLDQAVNGAPSAALLAAPQADALGRSPLHFAAARGDYGAAQLLLARGASVDVSRPAAQQGKGRGARCVEHHLQPPGSDDVLQGATHLPSTLWPPGPAQPAFSHLCSPAGTDQRGRLPAALRRRQRAPRGGRAAAGCGGRGGPPVRGWRHAAAHGCR